MDDARIRDLTAEVLAALDRNPDTRATESLEARVSALEAALARLTAHAPAAPAAPAGPPLRGHVSLTVLDLPSTGGERCVLEPDRPCSHSGACRTFGH
jgi:hypothetical protein